MYSELLPIQNYVQAEFVLFVLLFLLHTIGIKWDLLIPFKTLKVRTKSCEIEVEFSFVKDIFSCF